ncbi:rhomboid family intramembrane serine protease [Chloroflexota bacterium]
MRYRSYQGFKSNPIWIIIGVNFIFFIATTISPQLIFLLGLQPAGFLSHPWTILTNMFVHAGFGHFFGNMITLFFFGRALAMLVGDNKFLLVYFIGGILGNILYLLLGAPMSIAVGASGAVYAVAGALVVLMPNSRVHVYFIFPMRLWVVVLVFFVLWSFIPGVAWQAHFGGLIFGLAAGYFFKRKMRFYYR